MTLASGPARPTRGPRRSAGLRRGALLVCALASVLAWASAGARAGDESPKPAKPDATKSTPKRAPVPGTPKVAPGKTVLRFSKVSRSCYVAVHSGGRSNAGFIVGSESVFVVDCLGSPSLAKQLVAEVRRVTDKPIKHIALTHWHYDHSVGTQSFPKNAAILAAPASVKRLKARLKKDKLVLGRGSGMHGSIDIANVRTDVVSVMRDREFDLGGVKVKLAVAGGCHSVGDLVVYIPGERVIYLGDLVWNGLHPNVSEGATFQWIVSLASLSKLDVEVVVPGHGVPGAKTLITDQRRYFMGLRRMVKHLAKRDIKPAEIVEQLEVPAAYEKFGNRSYWQKTVRYVVSEIASGQ